MTLPSLRLVLPAAFLGLGLLSAAPARAAEQVEPPRARWSFSGLFGLYDRAQLQRGLLVYKEVCANCHAISLVSFRNLSQPGGPEFTPAQAAAIAADWQHKVVEIGEDGQPAERAPRLADRIPGPYPNVRAAEAANGGKAPPDLSLMPKARGYERGFPRFVFDIFTLYQEQGADYVKAFLTGYETGHEVPPGTHYNRYFPGNLVGMPNMLEDGRVPYTDGSPQTVQQYAADVTAFLMWTAEPHLEARKRIGFQVLMFLVVFAFLLYFVKKKIWSRVEEGHA